METLRRHILSNFAVRMPASAKTPTFNMNSLEVSGADELEMERREVDAEAHKKDRQHLLVGTTRLTKSLEDSDEDSLYMLSQSEPTYVTEEVENSDLDEFKAADSSWLTHAEGETSDPDEFLMLGPTKMTFTVEETDRDEFF